MVNTLSRQDIIEGRDFSVTCQAILGNPSSTTFYWTKVDNPGFRQIGSTLQLYNIQRTSYGTYRCTAENIYSNGEKGSGSQSLAINVICKLHFIYYCLRNYSKEFLMSFKFSTKYDY